MFLENVATLQKRERQYRDIELKMVKPNIDKEKVKKEKDEMFFNLNNIKAIVIRELMTGIWIEASKQYVNKIRERRSIENQMEDLTGVKAPERANEAIYNMTINNLLREYMRTL